MQQAGGFCSHPKDMDMDAEHSDATGRSVVGPGSRALIGVFDMIVDRIGNLEAAVALEAQREDNKDVLRVARDNARVATDTDPIVMVWPANQRPVAITKACRGIPQYVRITVVDWLDDSSVTLFDGPHICRDVFLPEDVRARMLAAGCKHIDVWPEDMHEALRATLGDGKLAKVREAYATHYRELLAGVDEADPSHFDDLWLDSMSVKKLEAKAGIALPPRCQDFKGVRGNTDGALNTSSANVELAMIALCHMHPGLVDACRCDMVIKRPPGGDLSSILSAVEKCWGALTEEPLPSMLHLAASGSGLRPEDLTVRTTNRP